MIKYRFPKFFKKIIDKWTREKVKHFAIWICPELKRNKEEQQLRDWLNSGSSLSYLMYYNISYEVIKNGSSISFERKKTINAERTKRLKGNVMSNNPLLERLRKNSKI